jgi:Na+/melibiose symporter-like transporter
VQQSSQAMTSLAAHGNRRSQLLLYGGSHVGKSILWQSADALTLFLWTEVGGIEPRAAGILFLISMAWSGLLDVFVGWRLGKREDGIQRWLLIGAPASAISFAAMFAAPLLWPQGGIAAAAVTSLLFRTAYAAVDVPQNFLMIRLADSPAKLVRLSGARTLSGSATAIGVAVAVAWLVAPQPTMAEAAHQFSMAGVLAAAVSAPLLMVCALLDRGTPHVVGDSPALQPRARVAIFMHLALAIIVLGTISKSIPYVGLEAERSPNWAGNAFMLLTAGKVVGGFLWPMIAARRSIARVTVLAHVVTVILLVVSIVTGLQDVALMWLSLPALGFVLGGLNTLAWAMLGGIVGTGIAGSRPAWIVGLFTVTAKLAVGVSGLLVGWIAAAGTAQLTAASLTAGAASLAAVVLLLAMRRHLR